MVQLLYFAWVREMVGTDSETITLPTELTKVAALLDWLATRSPGHAAVKTPHASARIGAPGSPVNDQPLGLLN